MRTINPSPKSLDANGVFDGTYIVDMYGQTYVAPYSTGYYVGAGTLDYDAEIPTGTLFGRWTDPNPNSFTFAPAGKVYWDRTEHYMSLQVALETAEARGELAIWDIASGTEIRVI